MLREHVFDRIGCACRADARGTAPAAAGLADPHAGTADGTAEAAPESDALVARRGRKHCRRGVRTLLWQDRQQLVSLHAELANARSDLALLTARLVLPLPPAPVEPVLADGEVPVAEGEVAAGAAAPIATSGTAVTTPAAATAPKPAVVAPVTAAAPLNPAVPVAASANTGHTGAQ